jgi:hypothetical protein
MFDWWGNEDHRANAVDAQPEPEGAGGVGLRRRQHGPTGQALYFKSHDARGRASFWSISVAGGRPRLLARLDDPARASSRFEFASDGKRFYFTVEDRQSDIWVAEVAGR